MEEHLRWHFAYLFALKISFPNEPVPSAKIKCHLRQAIIHRQAKTVAFNTPFITQRHRKCFSQSNTRILDGVMLVDVQVAVGDYFQVDVSMPRDLIEHMIKKMKPGRNLCLALAIKIKFNKNIRLFCGPAMLCYALA